MNHNCLNAPRIRPASRCRPKVSAAQNRASAAGLPETPAPSPPSASMHPSTPRTRRILAAAIPPTLAASMTVSASSTATAPPPSPASSRPSSTNAGKAWKVEPPFIGPGHLHVDAPITERDVRDTSFTDVAIIGSGPAGLAVAARVAQSGLSVTLIDPDPLLNFVPTYGVWIDEFDAMGFGDVYEYTWEKAVVHLESDANGKPITKQLARPYARIDREKFKTKLVGMCNRSGVRFLKSTCSELEHKGGVNLIKTAAGCNFECSIVVDCTGFSRRFVKFDQEFNPGYQGAYGILCEVESHPFEMDKMLFMDWRDDHFYDEPEMKAANFRLPTFLYAMPMGKKRLFLEETSLVARPAVPFDELKDRLYKRLHHMGVKVTGVIEEEFCLIPMGSALPKNPQRVIAVGGTGGHVHPSTGYMVARTIGVAPVVADAIVDALCSPFDKASMVNRSGAATTTTTVERRPRSSAEAEEMAAKIWKSSWPVERLRQREFFNFGMDVLLQLDLSQTRQFFRAFFELTPFHWQGFLSSRLSFSELIVFGLSLFERSSGEARLMLLQKGLPGLLIMLRQLAALQSK